jgi:hypothetical protein
MDSVYIVHAETEGADHYLWAYDYEPTRDEVCQRVYESEGAESLDWYQDTVGVTIELVEITKR